jgi:hypothetical protein
VERSIALLLFGVFQPPKRHIPGAIATRLTLLSGSEVVSRKQENVDLAIQCFAAFHVNKNAKIQMLV